MGWTIDGDGTNPEFTTLTEGQVGKADENGLLVYAGATVSPTTDQWTFDESINVPGASLNIGSNITLSDFGEILATKNNATGQTSLVVSGNEDAINGIVLPEITTALPSEILAQTFINTDTSDPVTIAQPFDFLLDVSIFEGELPSNSFLLLSNTVELGSIPPSAKVKSEIWIGTDDTGHKIFDGDFDVVVGVNVFAPPNPQIFRAGNTYFARNTPVGDGSFTFKGEQIDPSTFLLVSRLEGYPLQFSDAVTKDTVGSSKHNYLKLGDNNEDVAVNNGGIVQSYLPTSTTDTITAGTFIPGVIATTNPTVVTDLPAVFSQDDLVQIIGSNFNGGLFEVESHVGTLLEIRGIGTVGTVEDFTKDNFFHAVDTATITKVNVSVIRTDSIGEWEVGKGAESGIEFKRVSTVAPTGRVFFVHQNGDNGNSGLRPEEPLQTISEAIAQAILISPTSENMVTIEVIDSSTYEENPVLVSWVNIYAISAGLEGRITLADNTTIKFRKLENTNPNASVLRKDVGAGFARVEVELLVVTGPLQEGVKVDSGLLHIEAGVISVDEGIGIKARNGSRVSFIVSEFALTNGAIAVGTRTVGGDANSFSGNVLYAKDDGTCVLLESRVSGDVISIQGGSFDVNTAFDIGAGAELNLFATELKGIRIKDPTSIINVTEANVGTLMDSLLNTMITRAEMGNTVSDTGIIQISLTGTADSLLPPPTTAQPVTGGNYNDYTKITGLSQIAEGGSLAVASSAFVVGTGGDGDYRTPHAWVDMSSDTTATTVGFIFGIVKASDGLIHFSDRVAGARMSAQNDRTNTSGGGFAPTLEEGDELSVWVAADKTITLTIYDANVGLEMSIADALK